MAFRRRLPGATEEKARGEADRLYPENLEQQEFLVFWRKTCEIERQIKEAEPKALSPSGAADR